MRNRWDKTVASLTTPNEIEQLRAENQRLRDEYRDTETVWMDAKRLAMELECLLLSCELSAVSKWWDSAHEALELHQNLVKEKQGQL